MTDSNHKHIPTRNIGFAFYLKTLFVVFEIIGFFFTNSIAIISNAFHDGGDCLALALAFFLEKKSQKSADNYYSYGYKRYSLLSSVLLSIILIISSIVIIIEASRRFFIPEDVNAHGMMWLSFVGIIINLFVAIKLDKGKSFNEKVVFIHIMKDLLSWIGVLIVSIVMIFYPLPVLDAGLSILISLWVLFNIQKQLRESVKVFLQAVPKGIDIENLKKSILDIDGVKEVKKLNIWSLNGEENIMSVIVLLDIQSNEFMVKEQIRNITTNINVKDLTIQTDKN